MEHLWCLRKNFRPGLQGTKTVTISVWWDKYRLMLVIPSHSNAWSSQETIRQGELWTIIRKSCTVMQTSGWPKGLEFTTIVNTESKQQSDMVHWKAINQGINLRRVTYSLLGIVSLNDQSLVSLFCHISRWQNYTPLRQLASQCLLDQFFSSEFNLQSCGEPYAREFFYVSGN